MASLSSLYGYSFGQMPPERQPRQQVSVPGRPTATFGSLGSLRQPTVTGRNFMGGIGSWSDQDVAYAAQNPAQSFYAPNEWGMAFDESRRRSLPGSGYPGTSVRPAVQRGTSLSAAWQMLGSSAARPATMNDALTQTPLPVTSTTTSSLGLAGPGGSPGASVRMIGAGGAVQNVPLANVARMQGQGWRLVTGGY